MASANPTARSGLLSTLSSLWGRPPLRQLGPRYSEEVIRRLWWLTDVPTFMDDRLLDRLYNAIICPEHILLQMSEEAAHTRRNSTGTEIEGGVEASLPAFFKLSGKAKAAHEVEEQLTRGVQVTKQFVHNSERRLQEIIAHYGEKHPDRLLIDQPNADLKDISGQDVTWARAMQMLDEPGPRPLLFIELNKSVPIMPMAGGTEAGATVLLSEKMIEEMAQHGRHVPAWPSDDDNDAAQKKEEHWAAFMAKYDNWIATRVVDHGFGNENRLEWIDFRIRINSRPKPIHIHFNAAGKYHVGEFAYNVVRRGFKEGLRLVGRLKRGCDVNVIALYER